MKKSGQERVKTGWVLLAAVLIVVIAGMWAVRKEGFFLDEIYSYGLANSAYQPFLENVKDGQITEHIFAREELLDYVSVAENGRFDYASVYYNQMQDVHPPLFYFLLHTVCSLFPGGFTKWAGLALNGVLFLCTILAVYALSMELVRDKRQALFTCVLYALSREALSDFLMIRMYMLLTLLTVLLALVIAKCIHKPSVPKYLLVGLIIYLGMMTQYFYVVYAFLVCAAYDIYRMLRREWKEVVCFSLPAFAGVGAMMLSFPCWYAQLHSQDTVSMDTVAENLFDFAQYAKGPLELSGWTIIGFFAGFCILVVLFLAAIGKKLLPGRMPQEALLSAEAKLVTIPALIAFFVVAIIAPYKNLRYVYHLQPLEAVFCSCGFWTLLRQCSREKAKRILLGICLLITVLAVAIRPENTYPGNAGLERELEKYPDAACVYITRENRATATSAMQQMLLFQDVCIVQQPSSTLLAQYNTGEQETLVLLIAGDGLNQLTKGEALAAVTREDEAIAWQTAQQGGYTSVELLSTQDFYQVFLLTKP